MRSEEKPEFVRVISALAATFGRDVTSEVFEGYWIGLDDLSLDALKLAARRAVRECDYMPRPAELRRMSGDMSSGDRAIKAFEAVNRAMGSHGTYRSVDFDDPVINATIRSLGGWIRIGQISQDEWLKWGRKDFERIYNALAAGSISPSEAKYLPGVFETNNFAAGHPTSPPEKIKTGLPPHAREMIRELGFDELTDPGAKALVKNQ